MRGQRRNSRSSIILLGLFIAALGITLAVIINLAVPSGSEPEIVLPSAVPSGSLLPDGDVIERIDINISNVKNIIAAQEKTTGYYREIRTVLYSETEVSLSDYRVWARNRELRVSRITDGGVEQNTLVRGFDIWRWYSGEEGYYSGNTVGFGVTALEQLVGLPSYNDIAALPEEDILDAGFAPRGLSEPCTYIAYRSGNFGYETRMYISQVTGFVLAAEIYDGERLFFTLEGVAQTLTEPDAEHFSAPQRS